MAQTACGGAHSRTAAALAYNSSRCHRAFTCRLQEKSLSRNLSFKSLATLGHLTSQLKQAHLTLGKKVPYQNKVTAKTVAPI